MTTPNLIGFRCNLNHGYVVTKMLGLGQFSLAKSAMASSLLAASTFAVMAGMVTHSHAQSAANTGFVTEFRAIPQTDVDGVFGDRWGDADTDFVMGGDGVVRSTFETLNGSQAAQIENHNGNIALGYAASPQIPNITDLDQQPTETDSQIGNIQPGALAPSGVPECGPSPLSPEEVESLVAETAQRHGVDALFAQAITFAESNFDQHRNSDKGARGPMQLMPGTAERFNVADVCDPAANIDGGVRYLRVLLDEFENPILVAAAYNAGEGRVYEYSGVPPFQETVSYIAKVLNFQLGLPAPSRETRPAVAESTPSGNPAAGVIQERVPNQFVGGVMHF
jgi:hypothetical protein